MLEFFFNLIASVGLSVIKTCSSQLIILDLAFNGDIFSTILFKSADFPNNVKNKFSFRKADSFMPSKISFREVSLPIQSTAKLIVFKLNLF